VLIRRSMHPRWLSNAYIVGDKRGGTAVYVDSGAPLAPLLQFVSQQGLSPAAVLRTHAHADHVEHEEEIGLPVVNSSFQIDGLEIEAIPTPGHSEDMVCFVIRDEWGEEYVFSGDTLFKNSIGGGNFEQIKTAVMDVYMEMPKTRVVYPGHTDVTTIQAEWQNNPFVRVWRGEDDEGTEQVTVGGREATLVVWSDDYDGKGKAWVRYDDGEDAIVGGSSVERNGSTAD
jgi:glyoxylase-like metal-dependent hydrolase (beta-lactamase superfamily II)